MKIGGNEIQPFQDAIAPQVRHWRQQMRGLVGIRQILLNDGVFGEDFLTLQSQRRDAALGLIFRKFPPVSVCLVLRLTDSNSHAMPISCRRMRTTKEQAPLE